MTNGNSADEYKRMFEDAVRDLAWITEAIGLGPDEAGGAEPIINAIEELKARALSVCADGGKCGAGGYCDKCPLVADGGKDSSGARDVRDEESDVRPKERLCGGSHIACNGVDYCLGHPSCRDIANERAKKEQK